ncbi:MAG: UvrD-helicase domain-containing protein [Elusimicrobia bacterium]|nr:UvrD-helicase domain-containing protein [Elusimicrobiota bacterium]
MSRAGDQEERDRARLRLDANVVVVAGAGTGKTTLLTDRMLFNLLGRERLLPITSLVALTFTEKAAGEIRLRLTERLLELAGLLSGAAVVGSRAKELIDELRRHFGRRDEEVMGRVRGALEDMERAQIGTIHSFAAHILRLYPLQAGVDPGFRVDDGAEFDELFAETWARWLDEELGESAPRRAEWLPILREAPLDDLEDIARGLARSGSAAAGLPDPSVVRSLEDDARALRQAARGQPAARGSSRIHEAIAGLCAHFDELAAAAAAGRPPLAPAAPEPIAARWPADWDPGLRAVYERAQRIAGCACAGREGLLRRCFGLVSPFVEIFAREYARTGAVSFDGLLLKARDLVRDHRGAREELKVRYEVFLVDEFQDTDPLQGELLLFLAEEPGGGAARWQDTRPQPGRIFLVGDPKQSIYRFRGADIAAYQGFVSHLLEGGRALSCGLRTNFRSAAAVLEPVNAIFPQVMLPTPGSQPEYAPVQAAGRGPRAEPAVELVLVEPAPGEKAPDAAADQRAESAWIADWITRSCGGGKRRFRDVAVLMRASSALPALLEAFKLASIPYAVEMEKLFYGSQEVVDLLNLLRVLHDPEDKISLAGLLRSPLLGLRDARLYELAAAGGLSYEADPPGSLPDGERRRLARLFAALRELRALVGRLPLGEFVCAALRRMPFLEAAARAYHGQQTVSNLMKFVRLAAAASDERGMTLKEFIVLAGQAMDGSRGEGESPLADEHLDAVRVLSIHKAKGLEFPVVFLMNLSGASGRGAANQAVLVDWRTGRAGLRLPRAKAADAVRALLEVRERDRQADELVRLLYVAMTRAKDQLFLLGRRKADAGTLAACLAQAGAWPRDDASRLELAGGCGLPVRRVLAGAGRPRPAAARRAAIAPEHRLPSASALASRWRRRLSRRDEALRRPWTRTPTQYLEASGLERGSSGVSGLGALIGQACHKVLGAWDFRGDADPAAALVGACRELARSEPDADWDAVRRQAEAVLKGFLASAAARELARAEILGREVPFCYAEDGTLVRGTIDLVYRLGRKTVAADYKTEAAEPQSLPRLKEKYRRQGRDYLTALEKAWGIKGASFRLIFLRRPELA